MAPLHFHPCCSSHSPMINDSGLITPELLPLSHHLLSYQLIKHTFSYYLICLKLFRQFPYQLAGKVQIFNVANKALCDLNSVTFPASSLASASLLHSATAHDHFNEHAHLLCSSRLPHCCAIVSLPVHPLVIHVLPCPLSKVRSFLPPLPVVL